MPDKDIPHLDDRARQVLRYLVQRYLQDGQPVGSRTLANNPAIPYSPATVRNVMADLEDIGFLVSPHTSAGRIPSPGGIRFFIDQLLTVTPPTEMTMRHLQDGLQRGTRAEVQSAAANVISQITKHVGFVAMPAAALPVIRKLRFVKLSSSRVLAVIVTEDGDVLNRVFVYERDIGEEELNAAAGLYNRHFANMTSPAAQAALRGQMLELREKISALLAALLEKISEEQPDAAGVLRVAGEKNLLRDEDLSADMQKLRDLYELFEGKQELMCLLDSGNSADNVRVFIGSESGLAALDGCSVVFSSYGDGNMPLGLIGVIGPKRMRYNRIIPTVNVAAKLLRRALDGLRLPG